MSMSRKNTIIVNFVMLGFVCVGLLFFLSACEQAPPPPPPTKVEKTEPPPPKAPEEPEVEAEEVEAPAEEPKEPEFEYDPSGRREPFVSLVADEVVEPEDVIVPPIRCC